MANLSSLPFFLGIYASSPCIFSWNKEKEIKFITAMRGVIESVDGIEMPFWASDNIHPHDMDFYREYYQVNWPFVLTLIPGNMKMLGSNPHFGLASDDEMGRMKAIQYYKKANEIYHEITGGEEKRKVPFVQLVTSPSYPVKGVSRSSESLKKSLKEISSWNWKGTKLSIEHSDSANERGEFQKGFMDLKDEIEVIKELNNEGADIGITLNWGRSAIEGKSAKTPLEHIDLVASEHLLRGFIFSGAAHSGPDYGGWKDLHAPVQTGPAGELIAKDSLLTLDAVHKSVEVLKNSSLEYWGAKVLLAPPEEVEVEERVRANALSIKAIRGMILP
ncbi:MAG: DUF4862 family protein [Halobacteriovoraceae bacterium]|nr:DUF4862 family protein [Halobacteriovoraceae bacterium]